MAEAVRIGPRVIVVGTGHGCRVHVPALRAAGFDVVAVVGTDAERTQRRAAAAGIAHWFTDLAAAITATGATAVTVATPPATHAPLVQAALSHGCHVLCEKPFARDAREARTLLGAAVKAGVVHLLGNQFRMQPDRRVVARAIADGLIGAPRFASFVMYNALLADPEARWPRWWFDAAGGGWLGASGSHLIDQVRTWLGEFATLSASLLVVAARENVAEDSYIVRFTMKSGLQGILQQSGASWGAPASVVRVAGSHGTLWVEQGVAWIADRDGTRQLPVPPEYALAAIAPSSDPRRQFLHIELPPAQRLCETWRAAIEQRAIDHASPATFADGLATMQVIDAIRASAARGGAVVSVGDSP
jgi:predicted dehydrogenase